MQICWRQKNKIMIDLNIPRKPNYKNKSFKIESKIISLFEEYWQAAKSARKDISQGELLEAILVQQISRDKKFKSWQSDNRSESSSSPE